MPERPILFSGPIVRAIVEGRKTQTRRVVKGLPVYVTPFIGSDDTPTHEYGIHWTHEGVINKHVRCPYGQPGDRLWVRETWRVSTSGRHYPSGQTTVYVTWREKERGLRRGFQHQSKWTMTDAESDAFMLKAHGPGGVDAWRPSIHMPRWASRLMLEVTEVRVQRLQEISEDDARAEGVISDTEALKALSHLRGADAARAVPSRLYSARENFRNLWDSINGERSGCAWADNPWVWAVSFSVVELERRAQR